MTPPTSIQEAARQDSRKATTQRERDHSVSQLADWAESQGARITIRSRTRP